MTIKGLDRPRSKSYYLFYKLLFVFLFLVFIFAMYYATKQINYTWRWVRVPQYFWSFEEKDVHAEFDGTIKEINRTDTSIKISVSSLEDSTEIQVFDLPKDATIVAGEGEDVYRSDTIARFSSSKPGVLLEGLLITVEVSIMAIILGSAIGLLVGLSRLSDNPLFRWSAITYIEIIRGSPLLVQIFLWYFVIGTLLDAFLKNYGLEIPKIAYGVAALAMFTGAYIAEIVRAGIQSVHRGQMEAARSLGMTHAQAMTTVILPQAFRRILPPLAGQFISLIKDSSLLYVMAVRELTKATREAITSSLQPFELWFTCALMYLVLTFVLSLFVQYLERRAIRQ